MVALAKSSLRLRWRYYQCTHSISGTSFTRVWILQGRCPFLSSRDRTRYYPSPIVRQGRHSRLKWKLRPLNSWGKPALLGWVRKERVAQKPPRKNESLTRESRREWRGLPLWRGTSRRADSWSSIVGASPYLVQEIRLSIREMTTLSFKLGQRLGEMPQTEVDKTFAQADLASGLRNGIYEELSSRYAQRKRKEGLMVSSAFTVWAGEGEKRKGRFLINLHR